MKIAFEIKPDSSEEDLLKYSLRMFRDCKALLVVSTEEAAKQVIDELYKIGYQHEDTTKGSTYFGSINFDKVRTYFVGLKISNYKNGGMPLLHRVIISGNGLTDHGKSNTFKIMLFASTFLDNIKLFKEIMNEDKTV